VLTNCPQQDGSFPLASILASQQPDMGGPDDQTKRYLACNIPEINVEAIAYFAASIFWRGSVYAWNKDKSIPIRLGPYGDRFRRYLLGLERFPENCFLWVVVRKAGDLAQLTYSPVQERMESFHICKFPMPGLAFMLLVSKNLPPNYRSHCLIKGEGNPIYVSSIIEPMLRDEAVKMFQQIPVDRRRYIDTVTSNEG